MNTTTNRIRRTREEIEARLETFHTTPVGPGGAARYYVLYDALTDLAYDVRASARATVQGALHFAEPDVAATVVRLKEFLWLMARDDVEREIAYAREHQGEGWPELCAIATYMDRFTSAMWGEAVRVHPEIAEWAAGLPVPTPTEPEAL